MAEKTVAKKFAKKNPVPHHDVINNAMLNHSSCGCEKQNILEKGAFLHLTALHPSSHQAKAERRCMRCQMIDGDAEQQGERSKR